MTFSGVRATIAVDTPTFFAIIRSDQPLPPQGASKPFQVAFDRSHKLEHTPAVLTISYGDILNDTTAVDHALIAE